MDTHNCFETDDDAIAAYVAQLMVATGTLVGIANHMAQMAASGRSAPDAPPVDEVLAKLLRDVLAQLAGKHSRGAIERSATILAQTVDIVCDEIFLVPLDGPGPARPPRAQHRAAGRARRRR